MRRTFVAIACYFTLIHGVVSAWATVHPFVMQAASGSEVHIICYGSASQADGGEGETSAVRVQCGLCAAAAPLTTASPDLSYLEYFPPSRLVSFDRPEFVPAPGFSPRAGPTRGPPLLA
jgi:hypothetical protein